MTYKCSKILFLCRYFESGVYSGFHSTIALSLAEKLDVPLHDMLQYSVYQPHDLKLHNEQKNIDKVTKSVGKIK